MSFLCLEIIRAQLAVSQEQIIGHRQKFVVMRCAIMTSAVGGGSGNKHFANYVRCVRKEASAGCTNPSGQTGEIIYNSSEGVFQGCTTSGWQALHASNAGPTNGLIGWWKLDETSGSTVVDSSASGLDGTWSDGVDNVITTESESAVISSGLAFNGTAAVVRVSDPVISQADIPTGFSMATWAKVNTGATAQRILERAFDNFTISFFSPV